MNLKKLKQQMRAAGYQLAARNIEYHMNNEGLPLVRQDRHRERVTIRFAGHGEVPGYPAHRTVAASAKGLICTEDDVFRYREPSPIGRPRAEDGPSQVIHVRMPAKTIPLIEALGGESLSGTVRQLALEGLAARQAQE